MKISDIFIADDGSAVLAGCDSTLDNLDVSLIRQRVGASVIAKAPNSGELRVLKVVALDASSSLVGKKNVFLKVAAVPGEVQDLKDAELFTEGTQ